MDKISSSITGNMYPQQTYTKTAKAPYDGQKMDVHHALKEQDI